MSPTTPPTGPDTDDLDHLAGEYVLGTLSQATREAIERRMASEPALAERVRYWEQRLLPLTAMVEPVAPDPATWPRIADSIGTVPAGKPARRPATQWWTSLPLWRGLAFGGMACALSLALVLGTRLMAPEPAPRFVVVLLDPREKTPGWLVQASAEREIRLIPLQAEDTPPGRALQFWTKADDWPAPVSLGLVQPGETLAVALDRLPPLQPNQLFEITLEPPAGSPTGRPTGPVLYIGRAVKTM